jgi:hypothetical protein
MFQEVWIQQQYSVQLDDVRVNNYLVRPVTHDITLRILHETGPIDDPDGFGYMIYPRALIELEIPQ